MNTITRLIVSILGGELVTLLTGLIRNTPPMLVGAVHYGYPLPWLIRLVIAPQYSPWRIEVVNFFADLLVWSIITGIVVFITTRLRGPAGK
jgi:hypothetical protein